MNQKTPLDELKGIGEKTKLVFEKAGIRNLGDLLSYYPRTYRRFPEITDTSQVKEGREIAIYAAPERTLTVQYVKRMQIVSAVLCDKAGAIGVRWYNMPYLRNTIKPGGYHVFCGRIVQKGANLFLEQPAIYTPEQYQKLLAELQPVYVLTKGLTNQLVSKTVRQALDGMELSGDYLPEDIRRRYQLADYRNAIEEIHFPQDEQHMKIARRRLVFDEFFLFILALRQFKEQHEQAKNPYTIRRTPLTDTVIRNLGYELTGAQQRVWEDIQRDMTGEKVAARLIQGDVGSGKTILAFLAMILAAENGLQSALMVPTEVLARQHFDSMTELIEAQHLRFCPVLLTGSMTAREKRVACEKIASGEADMIIGTHALIQEKVQYKRMGLVITDEQHRFGVRQRELLGEKGAEPHTLVMSATPIPRTLAVILYGDLEISVIDELPKSRLPIKNCVVNTTYRKKAYHFIEKEIRLGHQAYIICPMVEENEQIEAEDVISYTERLREVMPEDIRIEYLHGKMKPKEKNEVMERFLCGDIQVLVSTTVVEVGVNVPNATVMMIENAERFGLAQLHQLRGRVGRGKAQSYCIMISSTDNEKTRKRLEILNHSNDGFFIASEDLKLRGPGDILGVRQSGLMEFKLADVFADAKILQNACEAADVILKHDSALQAPENAELHNKLENYLSNELKKLNL
ncbi:putative ATP-dependent DNA helicase RecG [Marvinbryantia formatexigens DSM 14469]|uniref:ATP-dependent DNA helicase RecG n=1 Tax=Marvinbryantia formatexigens DSM 14469 TaxID=478749 RepID=C6LES0_9FIRM|nr:ATP-dependent DNA helicase RecG [Marvinbryantia formatexigens]EET61053.1 putative ATP-dependent DNA helicase RecG [Marvinbryantia formatexigens DSM 14469]UWO24667.1 ATP-dependent DNA helicase RecG [Marvinbryantia formatexigens DSM 14469]SDF18081.1 ATP-dependent DNA helicase RecG [Marvinbryantia formatexigens]